MTRKAPALLVASMLASACGGVQSPPPAVPERCAAVDAFGAAPGDAVVFGTQGAAWMNPGGDVVIDDGASARVVPIDDPASDRVVGAAAARGGAVIALSSSSRHRVSVWRVEGDHAISLDAMTLSDSAGRSVDLRAATAGEHALWVARIGDGDALYVSESGAPWRRLSAEGAMTAPTAALAATGERAVGWLARRDGRTTLEVATWMDGEPPARAARVAERPGGGYFGETALFFVDGQPGAVWTEHHDGHDLLVSWTRGVVRVVPSPPWLDFASPVPVAVVDGEAFVAGGGDDGVTIARLDDLQVVATAPGGWPRPSATGGFVVAEPAGLRSLRCGDSALPRTP